MKSYTGFGKIDPQSSKKQFNRMTSLILDGDKTKNEMQSKVGNALASYFNKSAKNLQQTTSEANSSKGFTKQTTIKGKTSTFIELDDKSETKYVDPSVPVKGHAHVNGTVIKTKTEE